MGLVAILFVAFVGSLASACAGLPSPAVPPHWIPQPGQIVGEHDQPGQGRLQVVVAYGWWLSSHSALRLVTAEGEAVFWDPAGDYGLEDPNNLDLDPRYGPFPSQVRRVRDLIITPSPSLDDYVRFRWALADTRVDVFEWDLPSEQAARMRDHLVNGRDLAHPTGRFTTWTFPPWCTRATGEFLRRFASPPLQLTGWYFWPHSLAKALAAQNPARLRVFTKDGPGDRSVVTYRPPTSLPPPSLLARAQPIRDREWETSESDP
jgi:hypothetical protein